MIKILPRSENLECRINPNFISSTKMYEKEYFSKVYKRLMVGVGLDIFMSDGQKYSSWFEFKDDAEKYLDSLYNNQEKPSKPELEKKDLDVFLDVKGLLDNQCIVTCYNPRTLTRLTFEKRNDYYELYANLGNISRQHFTHYDLNKLLEKTEHHVKKEK